MVSKCAWLFTFVIQLLLTLRQYKQIPISEKPDFDNVLKYERYKYEYTHISLDTDTHSPYKPGEYCYLRTSYGRGESKLITIPKFPIDTDDKNFVCNELCSEIDYNIPFSALDPLIKYISVSHGNTKKGATEAENGLQVYGLEIRLITNLKSALTFEDNYLKILLNTWTNSKCILRSNGIDYETIYAFDFRWLWNAEYKGINMNLMNSYFTIDCDKLPKILVNTTNQPIKALSEMYLPQYSVFGGKSPNSDSIYMLKFNNYFSDKICHFGYKDATRSKNDNDEINPYRSNCGVDPLKNNIYGCLAPCSQGVALYATENDARAIDVLIQTRNDFLEGRSQSETGTSRTKYIMRSNTMTQPIIVQQKAGHLIIDTTMMNDACGLKPFRECHMRFESYNSFKNNEVYIQHNHCYNDPWDGTIECDCTKDHFQIGPYPSGTQLVLKMDIKGLNGVSDFSEGVYVITDTDPTETFKWIIPTFAYSNKIQPISDHKRAQIENKTLCRIFISTHRNRSFVEANCDNKNFCRGPCNSKLTIQNMQHSGLYYLMVVSDRIYGSHQQPVFYIRYNTEMFMISAKRKPNSQLLVTSSNVKKDDKCTYELIDAETLKVQSGEDSCSEFIINQVQSTKDYFLKVSFNATISDAIQIMRVSTPLKQPNLSQPFVTSEPCLLSPDALSLPLPKGQIYDNDGLLPFDDNS